MRLNESLCVLLLVSATTSPAGAADQRLGRVLVAGVDVSGRTPHEARALLRQKLASRLNTRIILTDGVKRFSKSRRDLGIRLDTEGMIAQAKVGRESVPLRLLADQAAMQRAIRASAPRFKAQPRNAKPLEGTDGVRIDPGSAARNVDVGHSAARLATAIVKEPGLRTFRLTIKKTSQRVTAARLKGITGVLGRYTTRFRTSQSKRAHNLRLATKAIDGALLSPGEVFSLNDTVGERTQKRGYRTAPVYENGKLVPGIGGGVSQVTGTLFNAALLAGLPILEYGTHAKPVPYIPVGRDATVAWKATDMRFRNSTKEPIYISYRVSGSRLIATLFGAPRAGRRISVTVRSQKRGPRHMTAQLYRTVRQSGKVVSKEKVGTSVYRWKPESPD